MLVLERVTKVYPVEGGVLRRRIGLFAALKGADLVVPAGAAVGLVGESGSGKTTLGKIIARHLDPSSGRMTWDGAPAEGFDRRAWAGRVQMVFQDPTASLNPKLTVGLQLGEAVAVRAALDGTARLPGVERDRRVKALLAEVGLGDAPLDAYPHRFSGGQRQRIAIARALALRPRLLVADEPVSSLDPSVQAQILNLLLDLRRAHNLALLIISHDLAVVGRLADEVLVMKAGEVVERGPADRLLSAPEHPYTRALLDAVPAFLR